MKEHGNTVASMPLTWVQPRGGPTSLEKRPGIDLEQHPTWLRSVGEGRCIGRFARGMGLGFCLCMIWDPEASSIPVKEVGILRGTLEE